ncbi:MAG: Type IV pili component [Alphaproteobacteria bacterium]|nr:Type IV pili component [Alphaproteobacteria bacterium]
MFITRFIRLLPIILLSSLLGACAADLADQDYRLGHPITVEQRQLHASFDRPTDGRTLPASDQDRLRRLADESLQRGAGAVIIASPDAGFAQSLADALKRLGITAILAPTSGTARAEEATIDIPVWVARLPECGLFERGLNPDYDNAPNSNWGCALQRNRAAMVQNPADLIRAQEASGRYGIRSADVLDKYGRGVATGSAQESLSAGSTSTVGH